MKKILSVIVCLSMLIPLMTCGLSASAASGSCGDSLFWEFDETTGTLSVTGSGAMYEYSQSSNVPWYPYRSQINSVELTSGVTNVSRTAFSLITSLNYNVYDNAKYLGNSADPYVALISVIDDRSSSCDIHPSAKIICEWAFGDCVKLTGVALPEGLAYIGRGAFSNCPKLSDVVIPQSVMGIGSSAFGGCKKIESITVPAGVTRIESNTFYNCVSLSSVTIPANVVSIGQDAFKGCAALEDVFYGGSSDDWAAIDMTSADREFFAERSVHFSSVVGGDVVWVFNEDTGILRIFGAGEMFDCDAQNPAPWDGIKDLIAGIVICDGVTSAGANAFSGCSASYAVIPASLSAVGEGAFSGCATLSNVYYSGSAEEWSAMSVGAGNEPLLSAALILAATGMCGDDLTWIYDLDAHALTVSGTGEIDARSSYDYPWYTYRTEMVSVTLSEGVTSIPSGAFSGYSALTAVSVPDSLCILGSSVFSGSYNINYNTYGNANYLGNASSPYLVLINLPEENSSCAINPDTKIIADLAFCDCVRLRSVTIPDGVETINHSAFANCTKLQQMTIPASVTTIGRSIFVSCKALSSIEVDPANRVYRSDGNCVIETASGTVVAACKTSVIPTDGTVLAIGESAFAGIPDLTQIEIPQSVTSIGDHAFSNCRGLTAIEIPQTVTSLGDGVFCNCISLTSAAIPDGIGAIGTEFFRDCSSLSEVTVPASVTKIGKTAFYGCSSLARVFYKGSEAQFNRISIDNANAGNFPLYNANIIFGYSRTHSCGNDLYWSFDADNGRLSIWGSSPMSDYLSPQYSPWYDFRGDILSIVISSGAATIGKNAFVDCAVTEITLPASVRSIGADAFSGCSSLTDIYYIGSTSDWNSVSLGAGVADEIADVTVHFVSSEGVDLSLDVLDQFYFANSKSNFGDTYRVGDDDLLKLCNYVKMIYGEGTKSAGIINVLQSYRTAEWGGSCYGMAAATILDKSGQIGFNENFDPDAATMHDVDSPAANPEVESAINYYFISQFIPYLRSENCEIYYQTDSNWQAGLLSLIQKAQSGAPLLFCYRKTTGSGHAIVIKGCRAEADGSYSLIAYDNRYPMRDVIVKIDRNLYSCVVNNTESCRSIEFVQDMSAFDAVDIDGPYNDYANFALVYDDTGTGADPSGDDLADITIKADCRVTVENAEGDVLTFENGEFHGSMEVENSYFAVADGEDQDNSLIFTYTVPNSDSFTFTPEGGELYASVLSSDVYASSETSLASSVTVTKSGVSAEGDIFSYSLSLSAGGETFDMASISGIASGEVSFAENDGVLTVSGADAEAGYVRVYSNTVDVDTYSCAPGYSSFAIVPLSETEGDVAIMADSDGDGEYDTVIGTKTDGCFHIWKNGTVTLEPTYTAEGELTFTCAVNGETKTLPIARLISRVRGDADGDGSVDAKDIAYLKKYLVSAVPLDAAGVARANVDGDDGISLKDVHLIRKIVAGGYAS